MRSRRRSSRSLLLQDSDGGQLIDEKGAIAVETDVDSTPSTVCHLVRGKREGECAAAVRARRIRQGSNVSPRPRAWDSGKSLVVLILLSLALSSASCAKSAAPISSAVCTQPAAPPVATIELPGNPFQAVPTSDGCNVFVSLAGSTEPSDPRRPPRPGAFTSGVAVVSRAGGEPSLTRVVQLEGSPWGMALTHDGGLLIVASDDRVAFVDPARLIAGEADAVLGYLNDAPLAGRFYANVTPDDRWLFLSDESTKAITVVDLARARASGFTDSAVVGRIPTGQAPNALTFSADHRFLYTTSQVAPAAYNWPSVCQAPGSEAARTGLSYPQGAILVIDVFRATDTPADAVVGAVPAGCNPVRLVTSPSGDVAYVSARTDDALLAFDSTRLL